MHKELFAILEFVHHSVAAGTSTTCTENGMAENGVNHTRHNIHAADDALLSIPTAEHHYKASDACLSKQNSLAGSIFALMHMMMTLA